MNISNCVSNWEFFLYFIHVLSTCAGRLTSMHGKKKKRYKKPDSFYLWKENPLTWFSFRKCFSLAYMYLVYISKINQVSGVLPSKVWLCIEGVVLILYSSFSMFFRMIIYQCFDFMFLVSNSYKYTVPLVVHFIFRSEMCKDLQFL